MPKTPTYTRPPISRPCQMVTGIPTTHCILTRRTIPTPPMPTTDTTTGRHTDRHSPTTTNTSHHWPQTKTHQRWWGQNQHRANTPQPQTDATTTKAGQSLGGLCHSHTICSTGHRHHVTRTLQGQPILPHTQHARPISHLRQRRMLQHQHP